MSWAALDDSWDDCPEFNGMSADAVALFFRSQARMARLLTDGHLTVADFERLDLSRSHAERRRAPWRRLVRELVKQGLWSVEPGGWRDTGWLARNPSRLEVQLQKKWNVLRQQIRFAKDGRETALREAEAMVKQELWAARRKRKTDSVTSDFTSELQGDSLRPNPPSSRPVPNEVADELDDDTDETAADGCPHGRRSDGRRSHAGGRCDLCARREMAEQIRNAPTAAIKERSLKAFRRSYGHLYGVGSP
jgi:hypothetical protein